MEQLKNMEIIRKAFAYLKEDDEDERQRSITDKTKMKI